MVNVDSDLVRAHPDWLLAPPGRAAPAAVAAPAGPRPHPSRGLRPRARPARRHGRARRPDYLKWDHNRDLHEAVGRGAGARRRAPADARRLPAAGRAAGAPPRPGDRVVLLRRRPGRPRRAGAHPAGVGQRLQRRPRAAVHPALDRAAAAAGARRHPRRPADRHTTGRARRCRLRCLTALFGHAGIEWDVTRAAGRARAPGRLDRAAQAAAPLLHAGDRARRGARRRLAARGRGADGSDAVLAFVRLATGADAAARPGAAAGPGPDAPLPGAAVDVTGPGSPPARHGRARRPWWRRATASSVRARCCPPRPGRCRCSTPRRASVEVAACAADSG